MSLAVQTKRLDVGYRTENGDVPVLTDINISIPAGEFVTILGPSGCGKSTLLRVIADLLEPIGGAVSVLGDTPLAIRKTRQTGFVFQESTLLPWRTVNDNINLPAVVGGKNASTLTDARIEELLELMGLQGLGGRYPSELSGGQRQRVAIARALVDKPKILLMDEPFGALDEITRDRLNDELLEIWRRTNTTVLFVTHSIQEAVYLGQTVMMLAAKPGRIASITDARPLKSDDNRCSRDAPEFIAAISTLRAELESIS